MKTLSGALGLETPTRIPCAGLVVGLVDQLVLTVDLSRLSVTGKQVPEPLSTLAG